MFGQVMKNSALYAKVRAMYGKRLSDYDYNMMMNMKSVPSVAAYLVENTSYRDVIGKIRVSEIHRTQLEQILRNYLKEDIERLKPYMSGEAKKFMNTIAFGEGISKLKICIRLLHIGHTENILEYLSEIPMADIKGISEIRNTDELIAALVKTPYYMPLKFFEGNTERQTPFYMEMALDNYLARLTYKYAKKYLNSDEAKTVYKIYGTEFDLENISFLLRCKKNFDMTTDEMYASIIPVYYRLKEETAAQLVKAATYEEAIRIIKEKTPYGNAFSEDDRFIEKRQIDYLAKMNKRMFNSGGYTIQSPICYIHLRKLEIDNIVSVIEGIRYGLEPDKISAYLVGYGNGGKL